jgi:hypothetical protein
MKVSIVYDPKSKRIRARCEQGGWVRFPKNLRQHGTTYEVENLIPASAGSWIVKGSIRKIEA